MSIFSSIGSGIKSAFNAVKGFAGSVADHLISNSPNYYTAAVKNAGLNPGKEVNYTSSGVPYQTNTINAVSVPKDIMNNPAAFAAFRASNPQGTSITGTTYGNTAYLSSKPSYGSVQLPVTISAAPQRTSGGASGSSTPTASPTTAKTSTITSSLLGGSSTSAKCATISAPLAVSSAPTSVNPGTVNTTSLAGAMSSGYTRNADGTYSPIVETKQPESDEQTAGRVKTLRDTILGAKPDINTDPEVVQARNERLRIQRELQAPTSELNAVVAQQQKDLLQLRQTGSQEGVTEAVYGGQSNAINYNAAVRALPLQASIASLQGDLKLAQDYLSELTQIKTEQINNQYEYNTKLFDAISGAIDKKDQRAYDELKTANDRQYQDQKDLIKTQSTLLLSATSQGAPQSVINAINKARTPQDAIEAAGQYGVDMLDRQYRQAQLDNIYSQVAERDGDGSLAVDTAGKVVVKREEAQKINKELVNTDAYKVIRKGQDSLQFLDDFEKQFKEFGSTSAVFDPIKDAKLKAKYNSTILNLKELFNLGVLNGPDEKILRGVIPDPTGTSNFRKFIQLGTYQPGTATQAGIDNMKKQIETTLDDRFKSVSAQYGDYSSDSVTSLKDLQRVYISQKVKLNPQIAQLVKENPDMTYDDIISVISK